MWLIIFFIGLALGATFAYAGFRGAPWVPTRAHDVERILRLAHIQSGQVFYDLGCGDGRLVIGAAAHGARAIGFEVSLLPYIIARLRLLFSKTHHAKIMFRDFWHMDLRDADVIYFFLMPAIYPRLQAKLQKELKPGATVLAYVWPFPDWKPVHIDEVKGKPVVYVYRMGVE